MQLRFYKRRGHPSRENDRWRQATGRRDVLDKQIDTLVYELYELTEKEIKIVEDAK